MHDRGDAQQHQCHRRRLHAAGCRTGAAADHHQKDGQHLAAAGKGADIHRIEARRPGGNGLEEAGHQLGAKGQPRKGVVPLQDQKQRRAAQDEDQ
ncbi:hypothetical protein SDC9_174299 [bioreactor metagenome]|uniref:Uncharacterized protein n=1 Tax=bioreactor metagenome TaxID=1076179 RepID=A0A645GTB8_9ZZZZ